MRHFRRTRIVRSAAAVLAVSEAPGEVAFRRPGQSPWRSSRAPTVETEAVKTFKATGPTPTTSRPAALDQGRKLYETRARRCHLKDGTGRLGPEHPVDDAVVGRANGDIGMFEIVYGGSAGAMQSSHAAACPRTTC